jgi:nicotinamidase-related amidase
MTAALERLGADTVHVVVDMQRLFAEGPGWPVPGFGAILPNVRRLVLHRPERTLYPRFVTPPSAAAARGIWQRYYRHWPEVVGDRSPPGSLEIVAGLADLVPAGARIDKDAFSAYSGPGFLPALERLGAKTILLTGVETDICVLSTALESVDRGYRVVIATDGVASSSEAAHEAMLAHIYPRYVHLIDLATTAAILAAWD